MHPVPRSPRSRSPAAVSRPEPATMEELLAEQDTDIRSFKHGDVVEGAIVRIDKDEIFVEGHVVLSLRRTASSASGAPCRSSSRRASSSRRR